VETDASGRATQRANRRANAFASWRPFFALACRHGQEMRISNPIGRREAGDAKRLKEQNASPVARRW
jgi:hypothetical protein